MMEETEREEVFRRACEIYANCGWEEFQLYLSNPRLLNVYERRLIHREVCEVYGISDYL